MKIKGFTLAEVLIVLAILGVIAALTLPAIMSNVQKQQVGPALMRAISTLDTANALVSKEQDFYNFVESCPDYFNDCFKPFVREKLGAAPLDETITYGKFDNPSEPLEGAPFGNGYITKNGIIYYIEGPTSNDIDHASIMVDVNGNKRPNVIGKDLFYLLLIAEDEGSKIYAVGSKALKEYASSQTGIQSIYNGSWDAPYHGVNGSSCNADGVNGNPTGLFCAGSIVDNGGRVIYKW